MLTKSSWAISKPSSRTDTTTPLPVIPSTITLSKFRSCPIVPPFVAKLVWPVLFRCHWYLYKGSVLKSMEIVAVSESVVPSLTLKVKLSDCADCVEADVK